MTTDVSITNHPNDETLAAFIDGQLDDRGRRAVVEHLAECADCREIVLMADEVALAAPDARADPAGNVVRGRFGKGWIVPLAAAASVAAVLFVARDDITNQFGGDMKKVQARYGQLEERPVEPRLSGFEYKPLEPRLRGGGGDDAAKYALEAQQLELAAETGRRSWKEYRALAAASLLIGKRDEAVAAIEAAAKLAPNEPEVINDLAAVYIEDAMSGGDPERAVKAAERAWQLSQTPETAWNRAVAYEFVQRKPEAIRAWQEYLNRDSTSAWAKEAQDNLNDLRNPL